MQGLIFMTGLAGLVVVAYGLLHFIGFMLIMLAQVGKK